MDWYAAMLVLAVLSAISGGYVVEDVARAEATATGATTTLYLNRDGGTFRPGPSDARTDVSSVIDEVATVSPWAVDDAGWDQVVGCVQAQFARWDVVVTDVDPGTAPHVEAVVAGRPQELGYGAGIGGIAPFASDCGVVPNAIVFAFAEVYGDDLGAICETVAQEVGHAFGLDHVYLCTDPMSYLGGCGPKTFQEEAAACGEWAPRECFCGGETQSSLAMLDARLGGVPTVAITSPADGATVGPRFVVAVTAADDDAVARVEVIVDGTGKLTDTTAPYEVTMPGTLGAGAHTIEARVFDAGGAMSVHQIAVTLDPDQVEPAPVDDDEPAPDGTTPDDDGDPAAPAGCSAGGAGGGVLAVIGLLILLVTRRRGA